MSDTPAIDTASRRPRRRWVSVLGWTIAAPQTIPACAWLVSDESYTLDLVANLGAQFLLVAVASLVGVAILRHRRAAAALLLCCALHLIPLLTGRAAFWPREVGAADATRSPEVVRILHYNDSTQTPPEPIARLVDRANADVVHLLCPSVAVQMAVRDRAGLLSRYAGVIRREWKPFEGSGDTKVTAAAIASRWPIRAVDLAAEPMGEFVLAGVVERPGGPFAVIAAHPRSPRTEARWIEGNAVVAAIARGADGFRRQGLPVVVLADLNATPTGSRSRQLYIQAGLRRCKPVLKFDGTHPNQVTRTLSVTDKRVLFDARWPARIAIDDAISSPDIGVRGWSVWPALGSEHSPILIELSVPIPAAGAGTPNPADR